MAGSEKESNMKICVLAGCFVLLSTIAVSKPKTYVVKSPEGIISVSVRVGDEVDWSISSGATEVLKPSKIALELSGGTICGKLPKVSKTKRGSHQDYISASVYKSSLVTDRYNYLTLSFKGFELEFRVYDEGAAYRIIPKVKGEFRVKHETVQFVFPSTDSRAWIPYVNSDIGNQFSSSFESQYTEGKISDWAEGRYAFLPVLVESSGKKVLITESGLYNYPGMYLSGDGNTLSGVFAPYPRTLVQGGHNNLEMLVTQREDYIARFDKAEPLPWRVVIVADDDKDLLSSDMPWLLGRAPEGDFSWVRPGKVAWDWWNDWNIYDVPFVAGINNETYKYYIDFASTHGIEYVILDEGWAVNLQSDLFRMVPEIDLPMLSKYAGEKGVGLILWAGYEAFEKDMEKACLEYASMGIKGFKVDFMNRDDQQMVDFYTRAAAMTARYGLLIDFHGAFKPAGLQRTYPNVVNFEGVFGLENMKWASESVDQVTYDVTIPFIRNVAGPMDYTQGAMRNASKGSYRPVYSEPMSQGTRCRQLAEYTVFFAPLTMLCDSPSNYLAEEECLCFISESPTVWDFTLPLDGTIGEYVAVVRRKGDVWYVGALNNWEDRTLELDLSKLGLCSKQMEIFEDGPNAAKAARDYVHRFDKVPDSGKVTVHMAPGGGWTAKIF